MLKEFIQHIQKTTQPLVREVGGKTFVFPVDSVPIEVRPDLDRTPQLVLHSLDALVKMVQTEASNEESPLYITIPDHKTVVCFSQPHEELRWGRQYYYETRATDVPGFQDGYRDQEKAIIELRSKFAPNEGTAYLLDLLSRISKDSGVTTTDNGVSQTVEARQGISLKAAVQVKPRVSLRPFRTFQEVEQPESEFLLRINDNGDVGLFEADGGMWKLKARETVKVFLEGKLSDLVEAGSVIVAL